MTPKILEVIEGSENIHISIQSMVPTLFFCKDHENRTCDIIFTAAIQEDNNGYQCSEKTAEVSILSKDIKCGYQLSPSKWWMPVHIPIKAKTDMLHDGNKTRRLHLFIRAHYNMTYVNLWSNTSVMVSIRTSTFHISKLCFVWI